MTVYVLDDYYLTITFLITLAWQILGFSIAFIFQFDKITDLWGGINFFVLALVTLLLGSTFSTRNIIASVFVMVWSARLGGFLLFRVLKTKGDGRFDDMRAHVLKFAGFWAFQILWVWVVSLPTVILNSPAISTAPNQPAFGTSLDIAGVVLFVLGLILEATADQQKYLYKSRKAPNNVPCTAGVWKYSRHPPYAGEITLHLGLYLLCLSPAARGASLSSGAKAAQYCAVFSPLLTSALLLFLSGIPIAEKSSGKKFYLQSYGKSDEADGGATWRHYKEYLGRTSILFPIPPTIYQPLPKFIKQTVLLDFPFYQFSEDKDGPEAVAEQNEEDGSQ